MLPRFQARWYCYSIFSHVFCYCYCGASLRCFRWPLEAFSNRRSSCRGSQVSSFLVVFKLSCRLAEGLRCLAFSRTAFTGLYCDVSFPRSNSEFLGVAGRICGKLISIVFISFRNGTSQVFPHQTPDLETKSRNSVFFSFPSSNFVVQTTAFKFLSLMICLNLFSKVRWHR